jgi:hypothetical protein
MTDYPPRPPLPLQPTSGADARTDGADPVSEASDAMLDALFAAARAQAAPQPLDLGMARIRAQASRLQPGPVGWHSPQPLGGVRA